MVRASDFDSHLSLVAVGITPSKDFGVLNLSNTRGIWLNLFVYSLVHETIHHMTFYNVGVEIKMKKQYHYNH
jgi:hypothetical protein